MSLFLHKKADALKVGDKMALYLTEDDGWPISKVARIDRLSKIGKTIEILFDNGRTYTDRNETVKVAIEEGEPLPDVFTVTMNLGSEWLPVIVSTSGWPSYDAVPSLIFNQIQYDLIPIEEGIWHLHLAHIKSPDKSGSFQKIIITGPSPDKGEFFATLVPENITMKSKIHPVFAAARLLYATTKSK
jgi:hypothetical protein